MNIGEVHVCVDVFSDSLKDIDTELDALRLLSMVNRDWHEAVMTPLQERKIATICSLLDCIDKHGICKIRSTGITFNIMETKMRLDPLCSLSKRLLEWRHKQRYQRIPDYSLLFSDSMFDMQKQPDTEIEIGEIMNTMRLLLQGATSCCFDGYPALKLCWLYLLCKFILLAMRHDIYPELFTCRTFASVVKHKLKVYREFLRVNVKKVPDRLRYHVLSLLDDLGTEYGKCKID